MFEEVFGEDEEKKQAKEKLRKHIEEMKNQKQKATKTEEKENKDSASDEDDDGDEVEEEENANVEPEIFGEVKEKEEKEFKTMEDTLTDQDNGMAGVVKKDEEDIVGEGLEKSIASVNTKDSKRDNSEKNGKNNEQKRPTTGKLDLKVSVDEEEEEGNVGIEHPIERSIIKTVIKNKAIKAVEKPQTPSEEDIENDDEMADYLFKEHGTKEEDILPEEEKENVEKIDEEKIAKVNSDIDELRQKEEEPIIENDSSTQDINAQDIKPKLDFLMSEEGHAYIGRKKSVLAKYGEEAGLFVGRVYEKEMEGKDVYLDGLNPHVVFVCGARGSGKSYVLGVIAEEMAMKNKNVGIVVVDPIGVFWSMKHPNKEEKEIELLTKWDLMPKGLDNINVFIPVGMKGSVPKSTYDAVFSIQPALLTAEDWCLTFGIERFSPTGLLMEKGIAKAKSGYVTIEGKHIRGKENTFSLEDLRACFEFDSELNDRDKGYKADSIRALVSRFDAAKHWGIFDEKGTPLSQLSRAGQMTILDTSFLEDNVSALVIGIIARRILSARKLSTRREAAGKFAETNMEDLIELNVPPTWLFIDEAHTLIPGGNQKTPASSALVEYVKQGRRPGCSLVFATQQPSAIDTKVLSQLDVIMAHKLVFDDDIKSIHKRTPAIIPHQYKKPNFIKTMPVGIALTGDRQETTTRAFIMNIRPRMSQHEGRDAETTETKQELEQDQVEILAVNITLRQLEKDPKIAIETLEQTLDTLKNTYKKSVDLKSILSALEKKGIIVDETYLWAPGAKEEEEQENETQEEQIVRIEKENNEEKEEKEIEFEQSVELTALQSGIDETEARKLLAVHRQRKKLGLFGEEEILDRLSMKYGLIYKVRYNYFTQKEAYQQGEAFINSITGEFIHDANGKIVESKGLRTISELTETEATAFGLLFKKRSLSELAKLMKMEEGNASRIVDALGKKELIGVEKTNEIELYKVIVKHDLPTSPLHQILSSIGKRHITEVEGISVVPPELQERDIPETLNKLWGNVVVKEVTHLFLPVWEGILKKKTGEERTILIEALNGKKIK